MVSAMLWSGDLEMEGIQQGGKLVREISEIGDGSELEFPRLYAERGNWEREVGV